jgi:hypothetical protein
MATNYPLKVQAIRSKGVKVRLYINVPIPLAAAIGLEAGEEVEWEMLSRSELHLVRKQSPKPKGRLRG